LYGKEFYEKIPQLIANGDLKLREHVYRGLEQAPQAMYDLMKGDNTGKSIVVLSDE
jgi:NADPH-dependent curcumin reductase CurA